MDDFHELLDTPKPNPIGGQVVKAKQLLVPEHVYTFRAVGCKDFGVYKLVEIYYKV